MPHKPKKIVSGGQTGADRAALDAANELGLECGGWVPAGRLAEDGPLPARYTGMTETGTEDPRERTRLNVLHSDATLILTDGADSEGTRLTAEVAEQSGKPILVIDLDQTRPGAALTAVRTWLDKKRPAVLNIAGPRESGSPGIYEKARRFLNHLLAP